MVIVKRAIKPRKNESETEKMRSEKKFGNDYNRTTLTSFLSSNPDIRCHEMHLCIFSSYDYVIFPSNQPYINCYINNSFKVDINVSWLS